MSNIRVSVQWKTSTVFAGEDVECTITFRNVSQPRSLQRSPSPSTQLRRHGSSRERWKETLPRRPVMGSTMSGNNAVFATSGLRSPNTGSYKPALSLSSSTGFPFTPSSNSLEHIPKAPASHQNKHRRSVSIVSIGGDTIDEVSSPGTIPSSGRPVHGHARAASLQLLPRRAGIPGSGSSSASGHDRAFTVSSPMFRSPSSFVEKHEGTQAMHRSRQPAGLGTSDITLSTSKQNPDDFSGFKFPQVPDASDRAMSRFSSISVEGPPNTHGRTLSPRRHDHVQGLEKLNPVTRVLSPASINGTPRSSGEFYSMSNNSTETLASEYLTHESSHVVHKPIHSRHSSCLAPPKAVIPEVLMMGYAQISGSFILDGSLVNQTPFEEAKRKGIVGGQGGGGVVRSESTKRDSGLLGSLGWGNIGDSLGGLLGGGEFSSIKEAKNSPNARSIPVLSTPQSILFVDIRLGPGESKKYSYRHPLPKGIPPSHKGRAMKIMYNLVVGTQRAAKTSRQHQMHHASVPFRVMTSVNDQGDILGHDLMCPHTILSDIASITSAEIPHTVGSRQKERTTARKSSSSFSEFLSYIEGLLNSPRRNSGAGLLSPTEPEFRLPTPLAEGSDMKDAIDLAILRSNTAKSSKLSATRFAIARNGERVAVIMLTRPAYRLGEIISVAIDFDGSDLPCYSLHATLETSEVIDPAIALRSKASIYRVTRRIHASQFESAIAARKVLFNAMIPRSSTPEFITSGISLEWKLKFEFVISSVGRMMEESEDDSHFMEEVARDERGSVKAAVQGLTCETFDVTIPLRVYGATVGFDEHSEISDFPI